MEKRVGSVVCDRNAKTSIRIKSKFRYYYCRLANVSDEDGCTVLANLCRIILLNKIVEHLVTPK